MERARRGGKLKPVLCAVLLASLLACAGLPAQEPDDSTRVVRFWNAEPRQPTTMHLYVYRQMEECTGLDGDFYAIQWFSADFLLRYDFERMGGVWVGDPRLIVLAEQRFNDPVTVSEEILHDLLVDSEGDDHEDERFKRCLIKAIGEP